MGKCEEFIEKVFRGRVKVSIVIAVEGGFHSEWEPTDEGYEYQIFIPQKKTRLGLLTRLTLLHECGHVIFNEMLGTDELRKWMKRIEKHKVFCFFQRFWYWNKAIRWIKRKLGFAYDISYSQEDYYDIVAEYTREENELFCDWFALIEKKWKEKE